MRLSAPSNQPRRYRRKGTFNDVAALLSDPITKLYCRSDGRSTGSHKLRSRPFLTSLYGGANSQRNSPLYVRRRTCSWVFVQRESSISHKVFLFIQSRLFNPIRALEYTVQPYDELWTHVQNSKKVSLLDTLSLLWIGKTKRNQFCFLLRRRKGGKKFKM